jgi:hypothetical protein
VVELEVGVDGGRVGGDVGLLDAVVGAVVGVEGLVDAVVGAVVGVVGLLDEAVEGCVTDGVGRVDWVELVEVTGADDEVSACVVDVEGSVVSVLDVELAEVSVDDVEPGVDVWLVAVDPTDPSWPVVGPAGGGSVDPTSALGSRVEAASPSRPDPEA